MTHAEPPLLFDVWPRPAPCRRWLVPFVRAALWTLEALRHACIAQRLEAALGRAMGIPAEGVPPLEWWDAKGRRGLTAQERRFNDGVEIARDWFWWQTRRAQWARYWIEERIMSGQDREAAGPDTGATRAGRRGR